MKANSVQRIMRGRRVSDGQGREGCVDCLIRMGIWWAVVGSEDIENVTEIQGDIWSQWISNT